MTQLDFIREQIKRLYKTNPNVHLNVSLKNPRITLDNTNAKIIGVYPHIFQTEEYTSGKPQATHFAIYRCFCKESGCSNSSEELQHRIIRRYP